MNRGDSVDDRLVIRALDQLEASRQPVLGPVFSPFTSPDGASVGFHASTGGNNSLQRMSAFGGPAVTICDLPGGLEAVGAS